MEVSIGRIVQYNTTEQDRDYMKAQQIHSICNVKDVLPAIVTSVHGEECVNLKVFLDGQVEDLLVTSISKGDAEGEWNWFPRV